MRGKLRVTQVRSTISHIARNRATIKALGLHGIGSTVDVVDNEATRGMVRQVRFLVTVEELPGGRDRRVAATASSGQGGAEHASEGVSTPGTEATPPRSKGQRTRARAEANDGGSRMGGDADAREKA